MSEEKAPQIQSIQLIGSRPSKVRAQGQVDVVEKAVRVDKLRANFEQFLAGLKEIIAVDVPSVGAFELEEVQFSAEISAEGEFKLLGTGASVSATSAVVFTLRKKEKKAT